MEVGRRKWNLPAFEAFNQKMVLACRKTTKKFPGFTLN